MVVLSWDDCKLDNPVVLELQSDLKKQEIDGVRVFDKVISGQEMLGQIVAMGVSNRAARSRIQGLLVGRRRRDDMHSLLPEPRDLGHASSDRGGNL